MARIDSINKAFDPNEAEPRLYKEWMDKGYFSPTGDKSKKPFSIVMPPPNITGQLHMGHALDNTLQDILTRYKRMKGYDALWLPGTDHASIATEAKIVEAMRKEGIFKEDIGREKIPALLRKKIGGDIRVEVAAGKDFPEDLSYCWFAFGPPKHTFYIPFPITLDALPDSICNGTFNDRAFKRFKKGNWKKETELESVEAQIYTSYIKAVENARGILKADGKDAKVKAAAVLKESFWKNWRFLLKAEQVDSRN